MCLYLIAFWLDHYAERLRQATKPEEVEFLKEQHQYYEHRYQLYQIRHQTFFLH